jgi:hypothetical protein
MTSQQREDCDLRYKPFVPRLSTELEKSLAAYATAAAAAGVSFLALVAPAEAKIVYTPANVNIPLDQGWVPLDLNHDGIAEFSFSNFKSSGDYAPLRLNARAKTSNNKIWGRGQFASALRSGFKVGPSKSYFQKAQKSVYLMVVAGGRLSSTPPSYGQWMYAHHRYLGLKFMIDGQVHYGWARVEVTLSSELQATLTGYAYETIPNKPIITGKTKGPDVVTLEPVSLGRLSQGASGISAWRARK